MNTTKVTHTTPPSPASTLLKWFDSLPLEAKQDMSYLVLASVRDEPILGQTDTIVEDFRSWINDIEAKSDFRHVGAVVSLRAVIEYTMMRNRGTMEDWEKTKTGLRAANALAAQGGGAPSTFDHAIQQIELRARRWIKIVKEWRELCATDLSDATLEAWITLQLPAFRS
jgi:diadenosine tetraphosphatase ApaH/serine/threonine PP2A family protein phosphatase